MTATKNNVEANIPTVLTNKVDKFKIVAREALRMKLISPRLSKITNLVTDSDNIQKHINECEHEVVVENYEISALDKNHPNYAKTKENKEDVVKDITEHIVNLKKEIEEINKAIIEQKEGINNIETGETKVSLEELNDMVDKLVLQDAKNQITA